MEINSKTLGSLLIGFGVILLFLLTFIKIDNDTKSTILCEEFHLNNLDMKDCPVHTSNFSWFIITAYVVGFIILAAGIFLIFAPNMAKGDAKKIFKKIDEEKLSDEEKHFYNIIKNKGGSTYQSDLIKETGFSKVKTTRTLDHLEARDIIERKRRGMTNIVILK